MKTYLTVLLLFVVFFLNAQERPFYIGHSLVNANMPKMVNDLAIDANLITNYGYQVINGSPLTYNFDNASSAQGIPYSTAFPSGNFNNLIITEAVPLQNHLTWSDTHGKANDFYNYAQNNNNNIPVKFFIYETWHCTNSGLTGGCDYDNSANSNTLWHPRLLADLPLWTGIVDYVRNQNPTDTDIWMVPAGQALYNLTTQINNGNLTGITSFTDLFVDNIHLNNKGNYFIACVMYATIFKQSPVGLTTNISNEWGVAFADMPTTAQAAVMQQVAWNTVINLSSLTGVSTLSTNTPLEKNKLLVYPNPTNQYLNISFPYVSGNVKIKVYNALGQLVKEAVLTTTSKKVDVSNLTSGLYYLVTNNYDVIKFVKN